MMTISGRTVSPKVFMFFKKLLLIVSTHIIVSLSFADSTDALKPVIQEPYFRQISVPNGLQSRWVNAIAQDNNGFIWVGSANGLQRYDGYEMLDIAGPNEILTGTEVYDLFFDNLNRLWIANEKSAFQIDLDTLSATPVTFAGDQFSESKINPVIQIKQSSDGTLWFARWDGVFALQPGATVAQPITTSFADLDFTEDGIFSLEIIEDTLFVGTSKGLYITDRQNRFINRINLLSENPGSSITISDIAKHGEQIWLATDKGLLTIEGWTSQQQDYQIKTIHPHKSNRFTQYDNKLWVATTDGLYNIDSSQQVSKFFNLNIDSRSNNAIKQSFFDDNGFLWLATSGSGMLQWSPISTSIQHFLGNDQASSRYGQFSNIWSIKEIDRILWVGTEAGLFKLDKETGNILDNFVVTPKSWHMSERGIFDIIPVKSKLWLATYFDIREFDPATGETRSLPNAHKQLVDSYKFKIAATRLIEDKLWIGYQNGLKVYSPSEEQFSVNQFTFENGMPFNDGISFIKQDRLGDIWVGSKSALYKVNLSEQTVSLTFKQQFKIGDPFLSVSDIHRMNQDELWIAYGGAGLFQISLKNNSATNLIRHYSSRDGLEDMNLYSLYYQENHFWISSHDGILLFDPKNFHFLRLANFHGVKEEEFNQFSHTILSNGNLAFGSVNGLFKLKTEDIIHKLPKYRNIAISKIQALGQNQRSTFFSGNIDKLTLLQNNFGIKIQVTDFNFFRQIKSQFNFSLTGDKKLALSPSSINSVTIAGLPYGDYELLIAPTLVNDETQIIKLPVKIEPPLYLTQAAYLAYGLVLSLLTLLIFMWRNRSRAIKQRQIELVKHSREQLQLALENSNSGVWDWRKNNDSIVYFRSSKSNNASTDQIDFVTFIERIHEDDRTRFLSIWSQFLESETNSFDCTYRIKCSDHQYCWVRDVGKPVTTKQNQVTRAVGTYTDITTTIKNQEQALIYAQTYQATTDAVVILDDALNVKSANPAFFKLSGFQESDIIDYSVSKLYSAQLRVDFYNQVIDAVNETNSWEGEAWLPRSKGKDLPVLLKAGKAIVGDLHYYFLIWSDISDLKEAEIKLEEIAYFDPLTELPNRTLLTDRLEHAIERATHLRQKLALLIVNLDHFKSINDSLGHASGDKLLIKVAQRLRESIDRDETVARLGSDEFIILLENHIEFESVNLQAQHLLEVMAKPININSESIVISPSIGISIFPEDGRDKESLLRHADLALSYAKKLGKAQYQFYTKKLNEMAKSQRVMEESLHQAVKNQEFYPVFQPRYDRERNIVGFEVLLRWKNKNGQHISPDIFIPIAEKLNLILPITEWLFDKVCTFLTENENLLNQYEFSINLSRNHFINYNLIHQVRKCLRVHDLNYSNLELEINESTLFNEQTKTQSIIKDLKSLGVKIAVDNFGTGYSSLSQLKNYDVDRIIVDRSFVWGTDQDSHSKAIVESIINIAKSLQLEVISEGIETENQLQFLISSESDYFQGYYLSKPLGQDELLKHLKSKEN
ncbi:MAG: EAL domain-containing protein [Gammaproteobacteria bacterium]|nr:EAL domain-containing protein [Gammaproteobacteria bacterium]